MKKNILFILFIFSWSTIFSQESQKGLLWKITGNGSEKPSYIYGNMHVSSKVAFRLGEEFFSAISSVDKIALESNPIIWLDEIMSSKLANNYIGSFDITKQGPDGFYKKQFRLVIPDNNELSNALSRDHYFMNWLLYRENKSNSDFEEETFLDMFIYQAGAKNNKEVLSLENFKENTKFVELASLPDFEDKEPAQWFKKLTRDKSYGELLEDAYRRQNLSLIDSLQREVSSVNSMYWMIQKRNEKMVERMDSIIKSGTSLFSGVGAAHLPGEVGILKMLEELGYTVTPMEVTFSDKARELREEFDDKKIPLTNYKTFETEMFSVDVPVSIYETPYSESQRHFFGPELTNGSHFTIKQISTLGYFQDVSKKQFYQKFDSLLFENIPGKIESKTPFKENYFSGFDIINKTKAGDYQRYKIYITPINIIIFKMGGKDDFVIKYGDRFFKSIKLKEPSDNWIEASTIHNDFTLSIPDYYSINYNTKISSLYGHPIIEAWDMKDSGYYNVQRRSLFDFKHIEEDDFELKRIAEQFFLKMKLDTVEAKVLKGQRYPTAIAEGYTKDSSFVKVKVIIKGTYYYLICSINKSKNASEKFFDSFMLTDFAYSFEFENKTDSTTMITVNSNYLSPTPFEYTSNSFSQKKRNKNKTEDESYKQKRYSEIFYSENYERISVSTKKFHIYDSYANVDSLWSDEVDNLSRKSSSNSYYESYSFSSNAERYPTFIVKDKKATKENGLDVLYVTTTDTGSSRAYYTKLILKHGVLYKFTAIGDTLNNKSKFVENFLSTVKPLDSIAGRSLFEDKASLFFKSVLGTDSLAKVFAFESSGKVHFKAKDIDTLKYLIDNYSFPSKYISVKKDLIDKLLRIKEFQDMDYVKNIYKNSGDTAMYQIEILSSLGWKGTKQSISTYLELLDFDIPISGEKYNNSMLFYPFQYALKNNKSKKTVFPTLLEYTFIDKYREGIISTLAKQVDSNYINPSVYKKNINQLLREAKIVLKEEISYEQSQQAETGRRYSSYSASYEYRDNKLLVYYATILIPHHKNKKVAEYLEKFKSLRNYNIRNEVFCRMQSSGLEIDSSIWNELAKDQVNLAALYKTMDEWKLLELFPKKYINQESMAKSLLFEKGFNFEEDSLLFIEKRFVSDGKDSGFVYFFKTKEKGDDDWELNYVGYQPKDTNKLILDTKITRKGNRLDKTTPIKEVIDEKVNIISLRHRPHADGSEERRLYGYYF